MDVEFLDPVHSSQILEALGRNSGTSSHKLNKSCPHFHIKALEKFEKPLDYLIVFGIIHILSILFKVLNIDSRPSRDHDFKLLFVKDPQESMRHHLVQSCQERLKLGLDVGCHFGIGKQLNVLYFILFSDYDAASSREQIFVLYFSKVITLISEIQLEVFLDRLVFQNPGETLEELVIFFFHVLEFDGEIENMLIESRSKVGIKEVSIQQSFSSDSADKLEVIQMLIIDVRHRGRMICVSSASFFKKPVIRIEHLSGQQLKPLSSQASCILAFFSKELNLDFPLELFSIASHYFIKRFLEDFLSGQRNADNFIFGFSFVFFDLSSEYLKFVLKGQYLRVEGCYFQYRNVQEGIVDVLKSFVGLSDLDLDVVIQVGLKVDVSNSLFPKGTEIEVIQDDVLMLNFKELVIGYFHFIELGYVVMGFLLLCIECVRCYLYYLEENEETVNYLSVVALQRVLGIEKSLYGLLTKQMKFFVFYYFSEGSKNAFMFLAGSGVSLISLDHFIKDIHKIDNLEVALSSRLCFKPLNLLQGLYTQLMDQLRDVLYKKVYVLLMHAESHYYTRNYGYFFFNQDILKKTAQKFT